MFLIFKKDLIQCFLPFFDVDNQDGMEVLLSEVPSRLPNLPVC